jgi:PhnB protein
MSINVSAHLNFNGNARKALSFYHSVFGGQLSIVTYADAQDDQAASAPEDVIWGQVLAANGFRLMAYDVQSAKTWNPGDNAFYLIVEGTSQKEIAGYWGQLISKGEIIQALAPSQWSPLSGMVKDQFGVIWVMSVVSNTSPN